jgi:hypothetical protein
MSPIQSSQRISDFFLRLADDPALLDAHAGDPRATMAAAGLTAEQIETVVQGGVLRVRETVEAEVAGDPLRRHLVVTPRMTVHTPTPDDDEPNPPQPPPQPEPERR